MSTLKRNISLGTAQRIRNIGSRVAPIEASGSLPSLPRATSLPPTMAGSVSRSTKDTSSQLAATLEVSPRGSHTSSAVFKQPHPEMTRLPGCDDYEARLEPSWETRDSNNERLVFPKMVGSRKDGFILKISCRTF
ncbi:unnamed protein product [Caenorhabditis nigoni]